MRNVRRMPHLMIANYRGETASGNVVLRQVCALGIVLPENLMCSDSSTAACQS
jgi:1,4-dihydroxy-2-naphthoyl-CoA synthase